MDTINYDFLKYLEDSGIKELKCFPYFQDAVWLNKRLEFLKSFILKNFKYMEKVFVCGTTNFFPSRILNNNTDFILFDINFLGLYCIFLESYNYIVDGNISDAKNKLHQIFDIVFWGKREEYIPEKLIDFDFYLNKKSKMILFSVNEEDILKINNAIDISFFHEVCHYLIQSDNDLIKELKINVDNIVSKFLNDYLGTRQFRIILDNIAFNSKSLLNDNIIKNKVKEELICDVFAVYIVIEKINKINLTDDNSKSLLLSVYLYFQFIEQLVNIDSHIQGAYKHYTNAYNDYIYKEDIKSRQINRTILGFLRPVGWLNVKNFVENGNIYYNIMSEIKNDSKIRSFLEVIDKIWLDYEETLKDFYTDIRKNQKYYKMLREVIVKDNSKFLNDKTIWKDLIIPKGIKKSGKYIYEVYSAPNKITALDFLKKKVIKKPFYYVVVETPSGNFGKDIDGEYKE